MTYDEFILQLKHSGDVGAVAEMKDLILDYPYFSTVRLLYARSLNQSNHVKSDAVVRVASLFTANKQWFYYYLNPERQLSSEKYRKEKLGKSGGDYFDMMDSIDSQSEVGKNTLRNLADRLRSARSVILEDAVPVQVLTMNSSDEKMDFSTDLETAQTEEGKLSVAPSFDAELFSEMELKAKELIAAHQFSAAIEILERLNLNNPKKSVYFADQIRFLGKIVEHSRNKS